MSGLVLITDDEEAYFKELFLKDVYRLLVVHAGANPIHQEAFVGWMLHTKKELKSAGFIELSWRINAEGFNPFGSGARFYPGGFHVNGYIEHMTAEAKKRRVALYEKFKTMTARVPKDWMDEWSKW